MRRAKNLKTLPKLPLSAFSPPTPGASDSFPLNPSPSTVHPEKVIDANVNAIGGDLSQWKKGCGDELTGRLSSVVVNVEADDLEHISSLESSKDAAVLALITPFSLETAPPASLPKSNLPLSLSTVYKTSTSESIAALKWALDNARIVDLDIQADLTKDSASWESFEDLLAKATADLKKPTPIVLSNFLPPPHDLTLPIVSLISHPQYRTYQAHTAALSLFPDLYVKLLPPSWNAPTPPTPGLTTETANESKETREWKRRIKMYLGPVLEAFGYERIIFGSSPPGTSSSTSSASDWYEIVRECLAELAVEQEAIDGVFFANAQKVYGISA